MNKKTIDYLEIVSGFNTDEEIKEDLKLLVFELRKRKKEGEFYHRFDIEATKEYFLLTKQIKPI